MARGVSPRKKMSLRTKIKPPKPFAGDMVDDVSSSIIGDRTLDSSEVEETSCTTPTVAPALVNSSSSQISLAKKDHPKSSLSKEASAVKKPIASRTPCSQGEASHLSTTGRTLPFNRWYPGRGMTPASNTKYLGPQTKYNEVLAPAAFPTLDTEELLHAWEHGRAPYNTLNRPTHLVHDGNAHPCSPSAGTSYGYNSHQEDFEDVSLERISQVESGRQSGDESLLRSLPKMTSDDDRTPGEVWDVLSIYWRLEIIDSIASAFDPSPAASQIFYILQLTPTQIKSMEEVLLDRSHRDEVESRAHRKFNHVATNYLKRKSIAVSEAKFKTILDNILYANIDEDNQLVTNSSDRQDAMIFLSKVSMNPGLLYDAIPPFTHLQEEIAMLNKSQFTSQEGPQLNQLIVPDFG